MGALLAFRVLTYIIAAIKKRSWLRLVITGESMTSPITLEPNLAKLQPSLTTTSKHLALLPLPLITDTAIPFESFNIGSSVSPIMPAGSDRKTARVPHYPWNRTKIANI